ncbi:MAG: GIY-YIG nuclease family protein [Flavobacterium sp.]
MHYLYIIYSKTADKFYIGETQNLEERLQKHNEHLYNNSFTKIASDWKLVLQFNCINRDNALFLEQFIKRMKSRKFIEKIISQPNILNEILTKL